MIHLYLIYLPLFPGTYYSLRRTAKPKEIKIESIPDYQTPSQWNEEINTKPKNFDAVVNIFTKLKQELAHPFLHFSSHTTSLCYKLESFNHWAQSYPSTFCHLLNQKMAREGSCQSLINLISCNYWVNIDTGVPLFFLYYQTTSQADYKEKTPFDQGKASPDFCLEIIEMYQKKPESIKTLIFHLSQKAPKTLLNLLEAFAHHNLLFSYKQTYFNSNLSHFFLQTIYKLWNKEKNTLTTWLKNFSNSKIFTYLLQQEGLETENTRKIRNTIFSSELFNYLLYLHPSMVKYLDPNDIYWDAQAWIKNQPKLFLQRYQMDVGCRNFWNNLSGSVKEKVLIDNPMLAKHLYSPNQNRQNNTIIQARTQAGHSLWHRLNKKRRKRMQATATTIYSSIPDWQIPILLMALLPFHTLLNFILNRT